METALTVTTNSDLALMPVMDIAMALNRREQITQFVKQIMKKDVDYGVIPGTGDKPALLKAGAEKLTTLFGLTKKFTILEQVEDWTGVDHDSEPFFYYVYRCSLYRGDLLIAEADGSCNSHESKYRYRKGERVCPKCGQANIRKSKQGGGWYCWAKLGGCGATFQAGDKAIESQEVGRVFNPDIADQANTILKMAQKRALVAATLLGTSASEYFSTKEVPGMDEDDHPADDESRPAATKPEQSTSQPGNGVPRKPGDLLTTINNRVLVQYDNVDHLRNALIAELGDGWNWPKYNDTAGWQQALDTALAHARAKEQPEPAEQDELPF